MGTARFVYLGLLVALLVVQRVAITGISGDGAAGNLRQALFALSTLIVIWLALKFRRILGAWLIALGIALNFLPMAAHRGLMPVSYEAVRDSGQLPEITEADIGSQLDDSKDILLYRKDIHFERLADRYFLDLGEGARFIFSAGDVVILAGLMAAAAQVAVEIVRPPRPTGKSQDQKAEAT